MFPSVASSPRTLSTAHDRGTIPPPVFYVSMWNLPRPTQSLSSPRGRARGPVRHLLRLGVAVHLEHGLERLGVGAETLGESVDVDRLGVRVGGGDASKERDDVFDSNGGPGLGGGASGGGQLLARLCPEISSRLMVMAPASRSMRRTRVTSFSLTIFSTSTSAAGLTGARVPSLGRRGRKKACASSRDAPWRPPGEGRVMRDADEDAASGSLRRFTVLAAAAAVPPAALELPAPITRRRSSAARVAQVTARCWYHRHSMQLATWVDTTKRVLVARFVDMPGGEKHFQPPSAALPTGRARRVAPRLHTREHRQARTASTRPLARVCDREALVPRDPPSSHRGAVHHLPSPPVAVLGTAAAASPPPPRPLP